MKNLLLLVMMLGIGLAGCGDGSAQVTKDEEAAFRKAPSLKDAPPGTIEKMNQSRARAAGGAQPPSGN